MNEMRLYTWHISLFLEEKTNAHPGCVAAKECNDLGLSEQNFVNKLFFQLTPPFQRRRASIISRMYSFPHDGAWM